MIKIKDEIDDIDEINDEYVPNIKGDGQHKYTTSS